jgi:hypothetical protein
MGFSIRTYNWYNLGHNCGNSQNTNTSQLLYGPKYFPVMAQQLWPKIFINKRSNRQYFPCISQVPREGPWEMRHGTILPPAAARRGNALDPPNERWQKNNANVRVVPRSEILVLYIHMIYIISIIHYISYIYI